MTAKTNGSAAPATPDFGKLASSMMSNWQAVNSHLINFAQVQFQSNLSAAQELRACTSPQDMMDFQMRLAQKNYESCMDEARQIGQMLAQMQAEAVQAMQAR